MKSARIRKGVSEMSKVDSRIQETGSKQNDGAIFWCQFVVKSAVVSLALLYLILAAEFTAVRAVYEAY